MIILSDYRDPHLNLALEETLLRQAPDKPVLFLWRSLPAVIIGKNQNPWKECDLEAMGEMHVVPARRISGGGAVYHDPGNLNCCLIMPRTAYSPDALFSLMIRALSNLSLDARRDGNSLFIGDRKISGSAYCLQKNMAMHHCTLLVDADLKTLHRVLTPDKPGFESKAVKSAASPVTNLKDMAPDITMERVIENIAHAFSASGKTGRPAEICVHPDFAKTFEKHRTWEWIFGHTPPFEFKCPAGSVSVRRGCVAEVSAPDGNPRTPDSTGQPFSPAEIVKELEI